MRQPTKQMLLQAFQIVSFVRSYISFVGSSKDLEADSNRKLKVLNNINEILLVRLAFFFIGIAIFNLFTT